MSRKALIAEIIFIPLVRGFFMLSFAFVCAIYGVIGRLIAVCMVGLYVYTVIDEVKLFREAYKEADH